MQKLLWFYEFIAKIGVENFLDGIKVNIYAYANKIVENNDFLNDFWQSHKNSRKLEDFE